MTSFDYDAPTADDLQARKVNHEEHKALCQENWDKVRMDENLDSNAGKKIDPAILPTFLKPKTASESPFHFFDITTPMSDLQDFPVFQIAPARGQISDIKQPNPQDPCFPFQMSANMCSDNRAKRLMKKIRLNDDRKQVSHLPNDHLLDMIKKVHEGIAIKRAYAPFYALLGTMPYPDLKYFASAKERQVMGEVQDAWSDMRTELNILTGGPADKIY